MKMGIAVLGIGALLLLGSCVSFGTALYRGLHAHPAASVTLSPQGTTRSAPIRFDTRHRIQVALRLDIKTPSARENKDDNEALYDYSGRYRIPVDYRVVDTQERVLHAGNTTIDWQRGAHTYPRYDVDRHGGRLTVETDLDKFRLTTPEPVRVEVRLGRDTTYGAQVQGGQLVVYDRVYRHTLLILLGIALAALGLVVTVIGVIVVIVGAIGRPGATPSTPSELPPGPPGARNWAMWCHLSALGGYVIPFGGLIAPLVVWLVGRERDPFIDEQGREAVNFRLTLIVYYLVSVLLIFVVIGVFLLIAVGLFDLIFTIVAGVRAGTGEHFRYPLTLRMVR